MSGAARPRLDAAEVRATLRAAGLHARHSLSQNFLADVDVLDAILAEADPGPGRGVLEIGPGPRAADRRACSRPAPRSPRSSSTAGSPPSCASGSPSRSRPGSSGSWRATRSTRTWPASSRRPTTSSPTCRTTSPARSSTRCSARRRDRERLVLMVQREVAERIAAPPGKMSYLSVFVQYHARVRIAIRVPPGAFEPSPAVESAVIVVEPYDLDDRLDPAAEDELWRLVQASFRERRKMLHNVLVRQLPVDAARVTAALAATGIDPGPATADARGGGVDRPARGARTARHGPARPPGGPMSAAALTPVVRLAPAKLNLTLAVIGRRRRRVPRPALGLRAARPGRPAEPGAGGGPRRLAARDRARSRAGRPTTSCSARIAATRTAVGGGHAGRTGTGARAGGPAREADPGRGRARRRLVRRRGRASTARSRRGAPSSRPTTRLAVAAGLGSDVPFFLAGGPALVEGRGERVAPLHGLRGAPGVLLVTPARRAPDRARSSPPSPRSAARGDGSVRMSSTHCAEELRSGLARRGPRRPGRRPRDGQRPVPGGRRRSCPSSCPFRRALSRLPRPADRAVRVGADPLGALCFSDRGQAAAERRSGRPSTAGTPRRARERTAHSSPRRRSSPSTEEPAMTRSAIATSSAPERHRAVQPGHRGRRLRVLLGPGRDRPGDGRAAAGHDRGGDPPARSRTSAGCSTPPASGSPTS